MIYSSLFLILASLLSLHAQPVATPANIVCYQEVVASQGSYAQINASLSAWSVKMIQALGLTGPSDLIVGWARVPDRTGFENGCTGPYPNIADLFVHIQTTSAQYDTVSSQLESFIAANPQTSQPNIVCSARSIVTFLPGCGKVGSGGAPPNNGTSGNSTTAPTTSAPTNATTAPTTSAPTNSSTNSTTAPPTSAPAPTAAPTNSTGNSTLAPTTVPSSTVPSSTGSTGNSTNSSTGSNSSTVIATGSGAVAGAGAADQTITGGVQYNGASSSTITGITWIMAPCIMGLANMFQQ
jgi:hypothetical protein